MVSPSWYEDNSGPSDDWLILPLTSLGANTCLSWYAYSQDKFHGEDYEVRISTTTPTPDSSGFLAFPPVEVIEDEKNEFTFRSVNLSSYANQDVYLAFRQTSFDDFVLALDDIRLAEVEENEYGMISFESMLDNDTTNQTVIIGGFRNFGSDTLVVRDSSLKILYNVDGGPAEEITITDSIRLAPNDSLRFWHDSIWDPTEERVYRVCLWFEGISDPNPSNDTICAFIGIGQFVGLQDEKFQNLEVFPNPVKDFLHVKLPSLGTFRNPVRIRIIDIHGREMYLKEINGSESEVILPSSSLVPGLYMISLDDGRDKVYYAKIIKQ